MFKGFEKDNNAVASAAAMAQPERSTVDRHAAMPVSTPLSCIGSAMSIVGNVECSGPAQVFGRIEGELRATELLIGEGAQVEGSIQAEDVTISGRVKGTIRAIRVSLLRATVEGDIFHRSLSVDENSVFEGASRRVENPVERRADNTAESSSSASSATGKAMKKAVQTLPLVSSAVPATNGASQP
jgi:cytoskeletal protein CcmA (bactofilin family)